MTHAVKEPVHLIESLDDLELLAHRLQGAPSVAVDLESDSFYTYYPKVCLIQLTADGEDYIVDPLAVKDVSPLGPMFRDASIEKIFHAAEYDVQLLQRDYGFRVANLFDTMAAARLLGARGLGLAALIEARFGVKLSKKLQRADWGKRPLTDAQIEYARHDTHFLPALRDMLYRELEEKGHLADARETFARLTRTDASEKVFDPDAFWRLGGARELSPQSRAVLKELYFFREKTSSELDKAPFRVLPEPLMVRLAHKLPASSEALERFDGMTPFLFRKFGHELLEAIRRGLAAPPIADRPERPRPPALDHATVSRYLALKEWRKNKAAEKGVDPVVVLPTDDLRKLSAAPGQGGSPSEWITFLSDRKRELYGEELVRVLSTPPPAPPAGGGRRRRRR